MMIYFSLRTGIFLFGGMMQEYEIFQSLAGDTALSEFFNLFFQCGRDWKEFVIVSYIQQKNPYDFLISHKSWLDMFFVIGLDMENKI